MSKLQMSDFVGNKQTQELIQKRCFLETKLLNHLSKNVGNEKQKFSVGDKCFDIITYKKPTPCKILDHHCENGWHKYLVQYEDGRKAGLRQKDLL